MNILPWPLGLAALCCNPFVASAQPALELPPLTLAQAQQLAATHSPALSAAQHEVEAQAGSVQQAGARRNPELSTSVEDLRAASRSTTVTVGLPLELGGQRAARIAAAERARDVAGAQLADARARLRAEVVAAYFAVAAGQARVQLAADSARLASDAAGVVGKRVAAGKVSPVDATRARVDAANAQLEAADAQAELQSARQALALLWGEAEPHFAEVEAELADIPSRPPAAELLRGVEASPLLAASRLELAARQALVQVERSKAVPDVVLSLGAKRDNERGLTQAVIGLAIPLPLFDRNRGAAHEAAQRADKARDELAAAHAQLIAELSQAALRLSAAQAALAVLRDTVLPAAEQAYTASTKGYEAGKFGFLDVIDAQRALLQARTRHLNTLVTAHQAATTIDRLLGR
jgi:cobalt-zinc-cadmium efflux system outer membrane protein